MIFSRSAYSSLLSFGVLVSIACADTVTLPPSGLTNGTPEGTSAPSVSNSVQGIIDGTNAERAKFGVPALVSNAQLDLAAQLTAAQLVKTDVFAHDIPGAQYPGPLDRIAAAGYTWTAVGENLGYGSPDLTAAKMLGLWIGSSAHHANMVNAGFTQIGVATATAPNGDIYMVQEFGHP